MRSETLASTAIFIAGTALAMLLVRRLRGRLDALDAAVPLLLLSGLHAHAITSTPNPAHGPVPFLLLVSAPLILGIHRQAIRLPLVVALTGAVAHTGFALLAVPFLLTIQAVEAWRAASRLAPVIALGASTAAAAAFLVGVCGRSSGTAPLPERRCPGLPSCSAAPPWLSPWRRRSAGFCLGAQQALEARYALYVLPGLAVAWAALRNRWPGRGLAVVPIVAVVLLLAANELWLEVDSRTRRQQFMQGGLETVTCLQAGSSTVDCSRVPDGKRRFLACLRAGWRAPTCTLATDFELHPALRTSGWTRSWSSCGGSALGHSQKTARAC